MIDLCSTLALRNCLNGWTRWLNLLLCEYGMAESDAPRFATVNRLWYDQPEFYVNINDGKRRPLSVYDGNGYNYLTCKASGPDVPVMFEMMVFGTRNESVWNGGSDEIDPLYMEHLVSQEAQKRGMVVEEGEMIINRGDQLPPNKYAENKRKKVVPLMTQEQQAVIDPKHIRHGVLVGMEENVRPTGFGMGNALSLENISHEFCCMPSFLTEHRIRNGSMWVNRVTMKLDQIMNILWAGLLEHMVEGYMFSPDMLTMEIFEAFLHSPLYIIREDHMSFLKRWKELVHGMIDDLYHTDKGHRVKTVAEYYRIGHYHEVEGGEENMSDEKKHSVWVYDPIWNRVPLAAVEGLIRNGVHVEIDKRNGLIGITDSLPNDGMPELPWAPEEEIEFWRHALGSWNCMVRDCIEEIKVENIFSVDPNHSMMVEMINALNRDDPQFEEKYLKIVSNYVHGLGEYAQGWEDHLSAFVHYEQYRNCDENEDRGKMKPIDELNEDEICEVLRQFQKYLRQTEMEIFEMNKYSSSLYLNFIEDIQ